MASIAQSPPASSTGLRWLWKWLRDELTPYPGRSQVVARMVIATTLLMIISMTFRINYGFLGVIFALLISRESRRATLQSAAITLLVTTIAALYLVVSAWFVISIPVLHFFWIVVSYFLGFYLIATLDSYMAGAAFAIMIAIGVPLWDRLVPAETNLDDTLWLSLGILLGSAVTAAVELVFAQRRPGDEVVTQIAERLSAIGNLLSCFAEGCAVDTATAQSTFRLAMLGTSLLRRILRRSDYSLEYCIGMAGVAALVGRLVDLAATMMQLRLEPSAADRNRFRSLATTLGRIRNDLVNHTIPSRVQFDTAQQYAGAVPLLDEMERTVALIPEVLQGSRSIDEYLPSSEALPRPAVFAPDAFANHEHLRFALKGCLAASGSYVIYNAVAWPKISTAVTTCLLTALSTIGSSHQKQILRIAGAIVGGLLIGMGSQIFILPHLDSIGGFTILFVLVTVLSAWFLTSSPRLSYFGLQVAVAFYFINLPEFKIQTSLAVARDRVAGDLLGLCMMWLVFDALWGAPAAVEMKRRFVLNLRLLAQFAREPVSTDLRMAIARSNTLRETINAGLDKVRDLGDAIPFEFGPSRQRNLELRSEIRKWQAQLRTLFLLRISSLKYRLQFPGLELPESVLLRQRAYDDHSARILEELADCIEHDAPPPQDSIERSHELLNTAVQEIQAEEESSQLPAGRAQSFVTLLGAIDALTTSLASDIVAERSTPLAPSPLRPA
jgi:multidrug resistance protein MdtO